MPLEPGSLLNDRYRIGRVLGQGGMGAVYQATDASLGGLPCAVKQNLALSPETGRLFRREASLLANLRHPNLPRVTHHFVLGQEQYLVMDYVEGEDLKQRLEREGPLPEALVLQWAPQICEAVRYLHSLAPPIIHRDIKPANIKLTPEGQIVLVDFGVARPASADQKTATATMAFTPGFAPPEQYGVGRADPRSDQYALAATLYTLLVGLPPPDSVERLLGNAHLSPPRELQPDLSERTAAALVRGLEIRPEDRFPDMAAFTAALLGTSPAAAAAAEMTTIGGGRRSPAPIPVADSAPIPVDQTVIQRRPVTAVPPPAPPPPPVVRPAPQPAPPPP